jgi:hypothetical protein
MKVKVINTQRQDRVAKSRKEDSISYIYLKPSFWSLDLFSWGRSISVDVAASCSPAISPCLVSYSCVGIDELVVTPASVQLSYYKSKLLHHCLLSLTLHTQDCPAITCVISNKASSLLTAFVLHSLVVIKVSLLVSQLSTTLVVAALTLTFPFYFCLVCSHLPPTGMSSSSIRS